MSDITIKINQQFHQVSAGTSITDLTKLLSIAITGCVFALNQSVVPRSAWSTTLLSEGDQISLFQAIAGG
ncbi:MULTISPECIES: sulfur carrier protein ThiS [Vibrio]|uniref:Sulfur carrier protein ThiS n=1 Tax=Vibrio anguillarum TaxID=55601 RepID=A0AAW4BH82_VIBAN|nr:MULTISPECIES: sulfur carrier protein ThiS [Vibrio]ASO27980.1 thiamine biosynthesis protein ThiS [Vibrio anguillarum]MBF4435661.1 sulfur carrier protein ThiS [Vibrio anguillarum]MCS0353310.1 sulfur carrier protein ThiS [Vibrio ordalii]NAX43342.1 sulfur carrier protein ThiS [Vibrio sp. V25_P4S6T154]NNO00988.1 sulfur carrier protein ThiS [Vibrio sp. B1-2]